MKAALKSKKEDPVKTAQMVVGVEDELPLCALSSTGVRMADPDATMRLIDLAKKHLCHLPLANRELGVALSNGSFLYQDVSHGGAHSEICTAECLDPKSVVIAREAGFANVKELSEKDPDKEWRIFRHCVDPVSGSSWATHCSVDTSASLEEVEGAFLPFVVSKLIFAGSGGFSEDGRFAIAPRLCQFGSISGTNTEAERPLICARKKPVVNGLRRQEFVCHESLRSHVAGVLDYGATMLVMILLNRGINPGSQVSLESPLTAVRLFASDPEVKVKAKGADGGRSYTALDLQNHFLNEVGARIGEPWMPDWAEEIVTLWGETLDLLALGSEAAADRLDWCIKLQLFRSWNKRKSAIKKSPNLMELDIRFGEMERGLFDQMDQAGLLPGHHVKGVDPASIREAMENPPPTRAQLRGSWIHELSGDTRNRYLVSWDSIMDTEQERHLRFQDRVGTDAVEWEEMMPGREFRRRSYRSSDSPVFGLGSVLSLYDRGRFRTGYRILREIESRILTRAASETPPYEFLRYCCWFPAKLGRDSECYESLKRLCWSYPERESSLVCDHVLALSSLGLAGAAEVDTWIEKGVRLMAEGEGLPDEVCPFYTHSALRLLRTGDNSGALDFLECALDSTSVSCASSHTIARAHTLMAEWYRLDGSLEEAEDQLKKAEALYRVNDFRAEYADFYLVTNAKVTLDRGKKEEAVAILSQASELQARLELPGEIRSAILLAKILGDDAADTRVSIRDKAIRYPSIVACPFLKELLEPETWKGFIDGGEQTPWMRAI